MILNLEINNWLCHKHTYLDFSQGLNLLYGENGSGKTSIMRAIFFGLFGECPSYKTIDKSDLIFHGEVDANIRIQFSSTQSEKNSYLVVRHIRGNRLDSKLYLMEDHIDEKELLTGNDPVTKFVITTLGIQNNMFNLVYFGEGEIGQYLYSTRIFRKNLIQKILKIDTIERIRNSVVDSKKNKKSEKIKLEERTKDFQTQIDNLTYDSKKLRQYKKHRERLDQKIPLIRSQIRSYEGETDIERFEGIQTEILKYKREIRSYEKEKDFLNRRIERQLQELQNFTNDILVSDIHTTQAKELAQLTNAKKKELIQMEKSYNEERPNRRFLSKQIEILASKQIEKELRCPTCDQHFSETNRAKRLIILQNKESKLLEYLRTHSQRITSLSKEIANLNERKNELTLNLNRQKDIQELRTKIEEMNSNIAEKSELVSKLKRIVPSSTYDDKNLVDLKSDLSKFIEEIDEMDEKIVSIKSVQQSYYSMIEVIEKNNEKIGKLETNLKYLEVIRLAVENVSEDFTSSFLTRLKPVLIEKVKALSDFNIEISDIDSEDLFPIVKTLGKTSPFQNLSGGEKLITYLAFRLSLLEIFGKSGFFIIDDPSDNLDSSHSIDLLEDFKTIISMIHNPLKQVIVSTNDIRFSGPIDSEYKSPWNKIYSFKKKKKISIIKEIVYSPTIKTEEESWEKFLYTPKDEKLKKEIGESILSHLSQDIDSEFLFPRFHVVKFLEKLKNHRIEYIRIKDQQEKGLGFIIFKESKRIGINIITTSILEGEFQLNLDHISRLINAIKRLNLDGLLYSIYFNKSNQWKANYYSKSEIESYIAENATYKMEDLEVYLK